MKFDDVCSRRAAGRLTREQAAGLPGIPVRTLRRREERHEANTRVPADTTMAMPALFDARCRGHAPRHFHAKPVADPGLAHGCNRVRRANDPGI